MRICALFFSLLFFSQLSAQDAYHQSLMAQLQSNYNLPAGEWVLFNTEAANLDASYDWGNANFETSEIANQPFSELLQVEVLSAGAQQWDAGWAIRNQEAVDAGDILLAVIWMRTISEGSEVNFFLEDATTYEKEFYLKINPPTEWFQYLVPFQASGAYDANDFQVGLHLAEKAQTVEIAGLAILNFNDFVNLEDLPRQTGSEFYGGWEPDAPWREEAATRIEEIRKADMNLQIIDSQGAAVEGASVKVEMLEHEFAFGTAVVGCRIAGNDCQNNIYQEKLVNLDGQGHGFNWVVFENDLKWDAWEENWPAADSEEKIKALQWLVNQGIKVRGHNLLWPGWQYLPEDMEANQNNPTYLMDRINGHLEDILGYPEIKEHVVEWDVLNEITLNRDIENALAGQNGFVTGRELYADLFKKTKELAPQTKTFLNDFVTLTLDNTNGETYDRYQEFIEEILEEEAPLDGIGFQAHIGGSPNSIYDVQATYDDFYEKYGLRAKITEYDIDNFVNEELAAKYLEDFLTITFAHPSMDGFLMWGFWDGSHWKDNAPIFRQDWSLKPSGEAFIDMVYNEWWTPETQANTDENGAFNLRGFKGSYAVEIQCGNQVIRDTFDLDEEVNFSYTCDLATSVQTSNRIAPIKVYPNPVDEFLTIEQPIKQNFEIVLYNRIGQRVWGYEGRAERLVIPINLLPGIYYLKIHGDQVDHFDKIIVQEN